MGLSALGLPLRVIAKPGVVSFLLRGLIRCSCTRGGLMIASSLDARLDRQQMCASINL